MINNFHLVRMALLWLMIAVIMCMHETYDITGIFYGINVRSATANGTVPAMGHALRLAFDTGSMLIAILVPRKAEFICYRNTGAQFSLQFAQGAELPKHDPMGHISHMSWRIIKVPRKGDY